MNAFKRTVSSFALALALTGAAGGLMSPVLAPAALAQEAPEARFAEVLRLYGIPDGLLKWASVEETGTGFIARGVYADLAGRELGITQIPLGDLEITALTLDNGYVTQVSGRFSNLKADLPTLQAAGQLIAQAKGGAQLGMGTVMLAGYIQGLGYTALDLSIDFNSALDFASGAWTQAATFDVAGAFKFDMAATLDGVTSAYVDWARANAAQMLLDPVQAAEANKTALADPNGPLAGVGYAEFALAFDDQGLMAKLEPQLVPIRAQMLGTNPDGTPKTELSDDDLKLAAAGMGGVLSPEKLLPAMKAIYNFVMAPDIIAVTARLNPPFTFSEVQLYLGQQPGAAAPVTDWNSRLTLEAHN
jgi:hypothetical protein